MQTFPFGRDEREHARVGTPPIVSVLNRGGPVELPGSAFRADDLRPARP